MSGIEKRKFSQHRNKTNKILFSSPGPVYVVVCNAAGGAGGGGSGGGGGGGGFRRRRGLDHLKLGKFFLRTVDLGSFYFDRALKMSALHQVAAEYFFIACVTSYTK